MPKKIDFFRPATVVLVSLLFTLLSGCAYDATPTLPAPSLNTITQTPAQTATPGLSTTAVSLVPTGTPEPTATLVPTATPEQAATPQPTVTPIPPIPTPPMVPLPTPTPLVKVDAPKIPFAQRFTFQKGDVVKQLRPGMIQLQRLESGPIRLNVLLFDLTAPEFSLRVVLKDNYLSGVALTSTLAKANKALAAVNGDLFSGNGLPQGMTMTDGKLALAPKRRATFAYSRDTGPFIGYFTQGFTWPSSIQATNGEYHSLEVLNTTCKDNWLCIYNELTPTLVSNYSDIKVVINSASEVTAITQNTTQKIAAGTRVLLGPGAAGKWLQDNVKVGDTLGVNLVTDPDYHKFEQIVSGGPVLLKDGKFIQDCMCFLEDCSKSSLKDVLCEEFSTDWKETHYLTVRMPRNVIGFNQDKTVLMEAVVDGYQPGYSIGMTQKEVSQLFLEFGAVNAMELDGGGSATMWVKGQLASRPSDGNGALGYERMVPDAVVFNWDDSR